MKKAVTILSILFIISLTSSCRKKKINNDFSNSNPLSNLITLWGNEPSDLFITVSSSYGVSLYDSNGFSNDKASTIVEAASTKEVNVGNLSINNIEIPFQTLSYAKGTDSIFMPSKILAQTNSYKLIGENFPSFELSQYSPNVTNLNFTGIIDKKLPRNSELTVAWTPDLELPETSKALLILYSENETTGASKTIQKEISDYSGSTIISNGDLSQFSNFSYIKVFYARGYNQIHNVSGKAIDLRFVNFSYSRIYFSN